MSWSPPLNDREIRKSWGKEVRKLALVAHRRISRRTPVDEGTAQGNWHISLGRLSRFLDPTATGVQQPQLSQAEAENAKDIYIQNNVPYILRLEHGHSKEQAPQGMVRLVLAELSSGRGTG